MDRNQIQVNRAFLGLVAFLCLAACAHAPADREPASVSTDPAVAFDLPNRSALGPWHSDSQAVNGETNLAVFARTELDCGDKNLYPTHPQQDTKTYHRFNWAQYNQAKLQASDAACTLSSKTKNSRGQKPCLRGNIVEDVVISDVYEDSCGHRYRGFWETAFLKTDETMGTLFAKGRAMYADPNSEFDNMLVVGHTYAVPASEFMFLSPLFAGDDEKATALAKKAEQTHTYDQKTHLFQSK